ncbi:Hypothetical protein GLP15_3892 [Giardia lamblia P15]|uniref:Uncharacterized protein n=1 Tax=Giardia intestinalis (strain P15) TaxID=658858 RepID=E1F0L3_GIAIA|nr:Hypothetical protein GLP15_3892 [Giardia lamblia P15]
MEEQRQDEDGLVSLQSDGINVLRMNASPRAIRNGHQLIGDWLVFALGGSIVVRSMVSPFMASHTRMVNPPLKLTAIASHGTHLVFGVSDGSIGVCCLHITEGNAMFRLAMRPTTVTFSTITSISCQVSTVHSIIAVTITDLTGCLILLINTQSYSIIYQYGGSNQKVQSGLPWPQIAESCIISISDSSSYTNTVLFAFGTITGTLYTYVFDLINRVITPIQTAAINASIGAEARCAITSLSAFPIDTSSELLSDVLSSHGMGFLLLATLLYSQPRLLFVDAQLLTICSLTTLPLHSGQMMSSIILSPTLLCTSGSDRIINIYTINNNDGYIDVKHCQALGTMETEIGRGFVSITGTTKYIVGITGDNALIAYSRCSDTQGRSFVRYNIPESHTGRISRIQSLFMSDSTGSIASLNNTLVLSASSSDFRVLASFETLPLCWCVIHGCSIFDILAIEPRNQQSFAMVGDENALRIITVPGWLRSPFESGNGPKNSDADSVSVTNPIAGIPAQLSLTVSPLWTEREVETSSFVRPPVFTLDDLRKFSHFLDLTEGHNISSEDRLLHGTTQFPEVAECCNFPGSNCMGLCQSPDGAYLVTLSIAGRVTEDTMVLWEIYKPSYDTPYRAGTQFLFRRVHSAKPIYGESYVEAVFLDTTPAKRPGCLGCTYVTIAAITEQGTVSIYNINVGTGTHDVIHLQPFRSAHSAMDECEFTDYIEAWELGIQPRICAGGRWVFVSYKNLCYRYDVNACNTRQEGVRRLELSNPISIRIEPSVGNVLAMIYDEIHSTLFIGTQLGAILLGKDECSGPMVSLATSVGEVTALHILPVSPAPILVAGDSEGCLYFLNIS